MAGRNTVKGKTTFLGLLPPDDPVYSSGLEVFSALKFKHSSTPMPTEATETPAESPDSTSQTNSPSESSDK
jgi:hypothetical protein